MVLITAVYVIATIFIYHANTKAANAAKEQANISKKQMEEMIAQYHAVNRPFVNVRFDIIRSGLMCFIIENEGPLPAHNVKIRINKEFIDNIQDSNNMNRIAELNDASFYIASKQKLTVFLGGQSSFDNISKEIAKIGISYDDFNEHTEIDIKQYRFLIIYNSPVEDMSQHIKQIKEEEKSFHRTLIKSINKPAPIQKVVICTPTEVETNKFED